MKVYEIKLWADDGEVTTITSQGIFLTKKIAQDHMEIILSCVFDNIFKTNKGFSFYTKDNQYRRYLIEEIDVIEK